MDTALGRVAVHEMAVHRMRILVCGGRDHDDRTGVWAVLTLGPPDVLIHGGCETGADHFANEWWHAQSGEWRNTHEMFVYAAQWELGLKAGPIRNQRMIDEGRPDHVIAFKGGTGTADMVRRAVKASVPVWEPFRRGGRVYLRRKPESTIPSGVTRRNP